MKQRPNQYKAAHKRLVLQGLALYYQEQAGTKHQDRRSVALINILDEIKKVLPSLNLEATHAESLLDKIVERSGLLIALDGRTRYQFTHLTLQEFFAALEDKPDQLIARFESDPGTWRETVKLWCGLEHDSTALIRAIAATDAITALECLGDTQQVDSDYATELIQSFQIRLGKTHPDQEAAARALALVAADPRPRGEAVFNELATALDSPATTPEARLAAAQVLSLTNLSQAANVLAEHAPRDPTLRSVLVQMDNLAVPALAEWAAKGETWALNALYTIGTPQAALALAPMLWNANQTTQHQAAWRLGALLADSHVEAALNDLTLSSEQRRSDDMDWVWVPFEPHPESPLRVVGGRVAHLLHTAPENTLPPDDLSLTVDPRLAIPLCAVAAQKNKLKTPEPKKRETLTEELEELAEAFHASEPASHDLETGREYVSSTVNDLSDDPAWRYLFHRLALTKQFELLRQLIKRDPTPTQDDWRNIFRPSSYTFNKSLQARGFKLGVFAFVCLALWEMGGAILRAPQLVTPANGVILLLGLMTAGGTLALSRASLKTEESE